MRALQASFQKTQNSNEKLVFQKIDRECRLLEICVKEENKHARIKHKIRLRSSFNKAGQVILSRFYKDKIYHKFYSF